MCWLYWSQATDFSYCFGAIFTHAVALVINFWWRMTILSLAFHHSFICLLQSFEKTGVASKHIYVSLLFCSIDIFDKKKTRIL